MAQILLVDDEKVARALYGDFLTGGGHSVTAVGSSAEAKSKLRAEHFDLLVTDLILPSSDGMELLQYVKSVHPDVEVIVITALDKVEPAVRAIKTGASDYLVKPVTPEQLAIAVTRAVTQHTLLKQNEELRRHVALLEAGQRIATTIDRERFADVAGAAFAKHCRADVVAVFAHTDSELKLEGLTGGDDEERAELAEAVTPPVKSIIVDIDRHGQEVSLDGLPNGFASTFVVPCYEGSTLLGAILLLYRTEVPDIAATTAPFLSRHVGLALKTLGRFEAVEDLVYLDDLTHLFNRRYLELVLEKTFRQVTPDTKPFALLFLDLDYFKSVNDSHGHLTGSKLLVEVARVLKGCVRDNDVVCRWGGDEYVILLRTTDSGGALKVAERIRRSIESHRFLAREGLGLSITTCIGIASYPEHADSKDALVDFADRAMYRGKKTSRNIIYMAAKGLEATPSERNTPAQLPSEDA
jgi:two-component system, cell cycle response regulator